MDNLTFWLIISASLFSIGLYGVLIKRNIIRLVMALEVMVSAVNLNFIAFSYGKSPVLIDVYPQVLVIIIIAIEAAVIGFILSLIVNVYRKYKTLDVRELKRLRW